MFRNVIFILIYCFHKPIDLIYSKNCIVQANYIHVLVIFIKMRIYDSVATLARLQDRRRTALNR
jgi:hypothetical protein